MQRFVRLAAVCHLVRLPPAKSCLAHATKATVHLGAGMCLRGMSLRGGGENINAAVEVAWRRLSAGTAEGDPIPRSSHEISLVGGKVLMFGGEHKARTPIDSELWALEQHVGGQCRWQRVEAQGEMPPARIGHAQAAIGERLYVMGGRQGVAMDEAPLDDLFCFDSTTNTWERIEPGATSDPAPTPRSFHRMVNFIFISTVAL